MASNLTHQSMILGADTTFHAARTGDHITVWVDGGNNTMQLTFYDADVLDAFRNAVADDVVTDFINHAHSNVNEAVPCATCGHVATQAMF